MVKERRLSVYVLVAVVVLVAIPQRAIGGGTPIGSHNVELLGQIGGKPAAVAVQGTFAYVGVGPNLFILDITDPSTPETVGTLLLPGLVRDIAVAGDYAYAANSWFGLRIIDVSDPAEPVEIAKWEPAWFNTVQSAAVSAGYAYLATTDGLTILSVADPTDPVYQGEVDITGYGGSLVVHDGYAYYARRSAGLRILDVSNPTNPEEAAALETVYAEDVALRRGYAYVASDKDGGLLKVADVSNPVQPQLTASCDVPGGGTSALEVDGDYVFLGTHSGSDTELGIRIIDISDPLLPNPVGFYDVPGWSVRDVAVAGGYAYVTSELDGGMRAVNVTEPTDPVEEGAWATLGLIWEVAAVDDYAYVSQYGASSIINTTDPAHPTVVGSMPWTFSDFEAAGSYAFLASGGLRILDISDPATPLEVSAFETARPVECLAKVRERLYLAEQGWWDGTQYTGGGLRILDVSDILSPREIGYVPLPGYVLGVAVTGEHVYLAYREEGLRIVDASDPANPVQVGSLTSQAHHQGVAAKGQYVYWGYWESMSTPEVHVLDVSDPADPNEVATDDTPLVTRGLKVVGDYLFVHASPGLYVIDISTPTDPMGIGRYGTHGDSAVGVAVADNLAYLASDSGGVSVLRPLQDEVTATIEPAGGGFSSDSGDTEFTFSAGAVTDTVKIRYDRWLFDQPTLGDLVGIGHTFNVTAVYSDTDQPAQLAPGQAYTITLHYTDADKGPAIEETLGLYWWDEDAPAWTQDGIASSVNVMDNVVTAQVDHFSLFAVLGDTNRVYLPLTLRSR